MLVPPLLSEPNLVLELVCDLDVVQHGVVDVALERLGCVVVAVLEERDREVHVTHAEQVCVQLTLHQVVLGHSVHPILRAGGCLALDYTLNLAVDVVQGVPHTSEASVLWEEVSVRLVEEVLAVHVLGRLDFRADVLSAPLDELRLDCLASLRVLVALERGLGDAGNLAPCLEGGLPSVEIEHSAEPRSRNLLGLAVDFVDGYV